MLQILQVERQLFGGNGLHDGADLRVAQTALGLPLKLGLLHADGDDRRHAFAEVLAGEVRVLFL
jgi:hypothetical protein